jgi:hypothetical protein
LCTVFDVTANSQAALLLSPLVAKQAGRIL